MSILRSFVHWYVWWGRNALYYYSRPFVWAWRFMGREDELVVAGREWNEVSQTQEKFFRAQAEAFRRDVEMAEREYAKALQRHHEEEQLCGTRLEFDMYVKEAQQNLLDAKREAW